MRVDPENDRTPRLTSVSVIVMEKITWVLPKGILRTMKAWGTVHKAKSPVELT